MDEKLQRARALCLDQAEGFIAAADRLGGGADWPHIADSDSIRPLIPT